MKNTKAAMATTPTPTPTPMPIFAPVERPPPPLLLLSPDDDPPPPFDGLGPLGPLEGCSAWLAGGGMWVHDTMPPDCVMFGDEQSNEPYVLMVMDPATF